LKQTWLAAGERLVARAALALEHHPRQVTALVAALLLTGGGGAFAVASLGPDPSQLPVHEILESVQPLPLQAQSDALDAHQFSLYTSDTVRAIDTAEVLLARLGVNDPAAAAFLRSDAVARTQVLGARGRTVTAEATPSHDLLRLSSRWAVDDKSFKRLVIERDRTGHFASRLEAAPLVVSERIGSGTIRSSLFGAVDEAGIPDAVSNQLINIFSNQVDFRRGLRAGDRFSVVYETLEADGEPMRTGRVLSAQFVNGGRTLEAVWFAPEGQQGGYFDMQGQSLERAFLASPVAFTRITSTFSMREHPIFHTWKKHEGVDFAAPTGTPVRALGDGKVEFAGWQNGYGNVIHVDHGKGESTVYAHLSHVGVHVNEAVTRGEIIGNVGMTGWATGPHLHFEFRENGVQRDPLQVARESQPLQVSPQARVAFTRLAQSMHNQLAVAASANRLVAAR
jgi:murein DD-endopeptidase MepM/ murein hydrolase activator NlpD